MRHPSENFIKFLMTAPGSSSYDDSWILHTLASLGFPPAAGDYLAALRADLVNRCPPSFQPKNRYHRESQKFLRDNHIWSLHHPDKATKEAHLLVTNLRARPIVENLLLGRMEPLEVAKKVNARLGEFFTSEAIEAYGHYYWNVSLLRVEDWVVLFENYDVQRQQALAIVQVGPSMALHKMGFQQSLETKTVLKEMMEGIYFDFREWKTKPLSVARTNAFEKLAKAASNLDKQLSQADSALKDSLKAFEAFRMQTSQQQVPDIKNIAGAGNYTGSGARLLEAPQAKEESND